MEHVILYVRIPKELAQRLDSETHARATGYSRPNKQRLVIELLNDGMNAIDRGRAAEAAHAKATTKKKVRR